MTRLVRVSLLVLAGIMLVAMPVLGYLYRAPVSVSENASTDYDMLAVLWTQNNDWLATNGFMSSTANDTRVQTLGGSDKPWLVCDNKTLTSVPVPADSQTNLYFVTGESAASSMDIIVGYDGYVTMPDTDEPGDNFTIQLSGYFDTDGSDSAIDKVGAFRISVDSGNVTSTIYDAEAWYTALAVAYRAGDAWVESAAYPSCIVNQVKVTFAHPVVGAYNNYLHEIQVWDSVNSIWVSPTSVVSNDGAWANPLNATDNNTTTLASKETSSTGNYAVTYDLPPQLISTKVKFYGTGSGYSTDTRMTIEVYYTNESASVTSSVTPGDHVVKVLADGTDFELYIDDMVTPVDTTVLGGASVPSNANDWVLMSNTVPYLDYFMYSVGGTLITWYQPNDIISGTTLPDRQGGDDDGAITWGANPAGVGVTLGSMSSSGQPGVGATGDTSTGDILPMVGGTDWRPDAGVSVALQANPLRPIVTAISDNTTLSEYQVWVWLGSIFVVFITVLVGANVRGHHLITGIAASVAIILMVVWDVFPMLSLLVVVLAILGGLISERSPSL